MLYRELGATGEKVSILGFGCMRLPVVDCRREAIDIPLATEMLHYALDHGVNYVDTAYPYHSASFEVPGASEKFVGEALSGGLREQILLATKLPGWLVKEPGDMDKLLSGQLERLRTDHLDCYLLHGLSAPSWTKLQEQGVLEFLDRAKADGRIRYAGFSFHDEAAAFAPIVDAYDWDFCQVQYNFMDLEYQAGAAGLHYAAEKGLGVIIMEPLKGGRLAGRAPDTVEALWDTAPAKRSSVEWALRFVWDDPGVSTLLSGMSTMDQVVVNVEAADKGLPGSLSRTELDLIKKVREAYLARVVVDCTACNYCMPCPSGINIPTVFRLVNNSSFFDDPTAEIANYNIELELGGTAKASSCTACGQCEAACPQQLNVIEAMEKAACLLEPSRA